MFKGKKLSILGDSISTYKGVSNDKRANKTTEDNPYYYRPAFEQKDTYWQKILDDFGMTLCVNNSWSGGNLSGTYDPSSGVNRSSELARDDGETPDFIIVFMGINDVGRGIDFAVFEMSYKQTIATVKEKYPLAQVCCVNLPDRDIFLKTRTIIYNNIIKEAVLEAGENFFIADLFGSRLNNDFYYNNTIDGLHPDRDGMRIIAEIIEDAMKENVK